MEVHYFRQVSIDELHFLRCGEISALDVSRDVAKAWVLVSLMQQHFRFLQAPNS